MSVSCPISTKKGRQQVRGFLAYLQMKDASDANRVEELIQQYNASNGSPFNTWHRNPPSTWKNRAWTVSSKSPHVGWGIPIIQELTCQNLLFILNRWFVPSCSCCVFFLNLACSFLTQFLSLKQIFCVFWFRYLHYEESVHMNDILPFFLCVLKMVSLFRGSGSRKWSNILFLTESFIFPTSGFSRTPILIFPLSPCSPGCTSA